MSQEIYVNEARAKEASFDQGLHGGVVSILSAEVQSQPPEEFLLKPPIGVKL
jgi:hypothetical protein